MKSGLTQIKLPKDRVDQLRQFAQGMDDATLSETLGNFFKWAREQGLVQHGIPSVTINTLSDGMALKFDSGTTACFSFDEATKIANEIHAYLAGKRTGQKIMYITEAYNSSYIIHGKGNGVAIAIPANAAPKIFTRDLAAEFAELLEIEVAKCIPSEPV